MISECLIKQIKKHEGYVRFPYNDSVGTPTIGYGRNLKSVGLSRQEAGILLLNDIDIAFHQLIDKYPESVNLDQKRFEALVNMVFNLGIGRFMGFKKMIAALKIEDFDLAADEALDSRWAIQVGNRAFELSEQIRNGV